MDRLTLVDAVESRLWMETWIRDPCRQVDVRMTYEDLKILTDILDEALMRRKTK